MCRPLDERVDRSLLLTKSPVDRNFECAAGGWWSFASRFRGFFHYNGHALFDDYRRNGRNMPVVVVAGPVYNGRTRTYSVTVHTCARTHIVL